MKRAGFSLVDMDDFEEKAIQCFRVGDMEALRKLYAKAAATARMTGGRSAGRAVEATLRRVLTSVNDDPRIRRGIFSDL